MESVWVQVKIEMFEVQIMLMLIMEPERLTCPVHW